MKEELILRKENSVGIIILCVIKVELYFLGNVMFLAIKINNNSILKYVAARGFCTIGENATRDKIRNWKLCKIVTVWEYFFSGP